MSSEKLLRNAAATRGKDRARAREGEGNSGGTGLRSKAAAGYRRLGVASDRRHDIADDRGDNDGPCLAGQDKSESAATNESSIHSRAHNLDSMSTALPTQWPDSEGSADEDDEPQWAARLAPGLHEYFQSNIKRARVWSGFQEAGLILEPQVLVVGMTQTLDILKGLLVLSLAVAEVTHAITTPGTLMASSSNANNNIGLLLCNVAAMTGFSGFMLVWGFMCYTKFLRAWAGQPTALPQTAGFHLACAWISNCAWCFFNARHELSFWSLLGALSFTESNGTAPTILFASALYLVLAYVMWAPLSTALATLESERLRDVAALIAAISPALITFFPASDCAWEPRWVRLLIPCADNVYDSTKWGQIAVLPYMMNFSLGIVFAVGWDRFLSKAKPLGVRGDIARFSMIRWPVAYHWIGVVWCVTSILQSAFLPLGQEILSQDFTDARFATSVGWLIRGQPGGPSALGLVASLWPVWSGGFISALVVCFVRLRGMHPNDDSSLARRGMLSSIVGFAFKELEHLGSNSVYYITIVSIFVAGIYRGDHARTAAMDSSTFLVSEALISAGSALLVGRFFQLAAKAARK